MTDDRGFDRGGGQGVAQLSLHSSSSETSKETHVETGPQTENKAGKTTTAMEASAVEFTFASDPCFGRSARLESQLLAGRANTTRTSKAHSTLIESTTWPQQLDGESSE